MCWYVAWAPTPRNDRLGGIYILPHNSSHWTEATTFCRRAHRTVRAHQACTVHCPVPCPCQPTIGVCSSRPLDPTVIQIVRCTLDSLVLQPESARCGSLCTDCPVSHQIVRCTLNRLLFVSSAPPVRWLTAAFMDFFPDSLGFFCS
jgi:hypothetical protein